MQLKPQIADSFDEHYKVDKRTNCWIWTRALKGRKEDRNNYGHLRVNGKLMAAHRFSFLRTMLIRFSPKELVK